MFVRGRFGGISVNIDITHIPLATSAHGSDLRAPNRDYRLRRGVSPVNFLQPEWHQPMTNMKRLCSHINKVILPSYRK